MMTALSEVVTTFVVTDAPTAPASRAWDRQAAADFAREQGWVAISEPDFDRAIERATSMAKTTVITGSFHTVGDAMARSRDAVGALEAAQAGNEITALSVKQALALQSLLAAQHRAELVTRARDLATEDEARQRFKTFLGNGRAYAASR